MTNSAAPPPAGLTIGDLARRTGVSTATLRAWESRHGFPEPHRLASGHRRYTEAEVEQVLQVVRRRDAGIRLESAMAEVSAARHSATSSVFAELRRRQPHLAPQPLRKSTLLDLTWAMEDECCARAQRPTLFAAFQHERYYNRSLARWNELTRTSRSTVIFADFDGASSRADRGATLVHIPHEAPMRREWTLVCDAPDHPAALAAWELPGQDDVADRDRVFESVWTLEPPAVRDAARACAGLAQSFAPHVVDASFASLESTPPAASDDLRAASSLFSRLVSYVDRDH